MIKRELAFDFDDTPRRFVDVETGETVAVFAQNVQEAYEKKVTEYFKKLSLICAQNKIKYVEVNVGDPFEKVLTTYLAEKQMFG